MISELPNRTLCIGCSACADVCHVNAIEFKADYEGFLYPTINNSKCVQCNICSSVCPILAKRNGNNHYTISPLCFSAKSKKDVIRNASSSGGIFSILALAILKQDGVVYGASFDKDFLVHHVRIDSETELDCLRGSKYIQSNTSGVYKTCKLDLISGKTVLFSGTSCQIAGLLSYLQKDYPNLLTVDIICHGVPSPAIWLKYLSEVKKTKLRKSPCRVSFRDKSVSWRRYSLTLETTESKLSEEYTKNIFMKIFLKNLCLRPSCYNCQFKSGTCGSDFTLGDFWGIERLHSNLDDDKGVSAVIVHTEKAKQFWNNISFELDYETCNIEDIIAGNQSYTTSVNKPKEYTDFRKYVVPMKLEKAYNRSVYGNLLQRAIKKIVTKMFSHYCWGKSVNGN